MPSGFNNKPNSSNIGNTLLENAASSISGIFSTRPTAKYASGARCILKINDQIVGFAFGVSWRINTTAVEINTIDNYFPAELVPQRITVEGTISALHIPGTSATTEGWQGDALSFLFHNYITIEVRDSVTDSILFLTRKAMIVSRQEEVRVDSLASVTLSFRAIGWRDEKEPALPEDTEPQFNSEAIDSPNRPSPDATIKNFEKQQNVKKGIQESNNITGSIQRGNQTVSGVPVGVNSSLNTKR